MGRVWHSATAGRRGDGGGAALCLDGTIFTSFRAGACQAKSPWRTIDRLVVLGGHGVVIEVEARSFLHHQVRNMVGTLKLVGDGTWPPERVVVALAALSRAAAGPTAPPDGLTLTGVDYAVAVFPEAGG